jgi:hypothetical protein
MRYGEQHDETQPDLWIGMLYIQLTEPNTAAETFTKNSCFYTFISHYEVLRRRLPIVLLEVVVQGNQDTTAQSSTIIQTSSIPSQEASKQV